MRSLSRITFIIVLLLCLGHAAYYYPLLPERVASHFNASGKPDAWSDKDFFFKTYLFTVAFIAALFTVISSAIRWIPDSLINLPNKDYWLSPGRRPETNRSGKGMIRCPE